MAYLGSSKELSLTGEILVERKEGAMAVKIGWEMMGSFGETDVGFCLTVLKQSNEMWGKKSPGVGFREGSGYLWVLLSIASLKHNTP